MYECAKRSLYKENIYDLDPTIDYYTCCFTTAKISEAFTQIYSSQALYGQIFGTDSRLKSASIGDIQEYAKMNSIGICFKFNRSKFKESLITNLKKNTQLKEFKLYEGYMQYNSATNIDKITNEQNHKNHEFNKSFCELITCKNENFKYEEEFRYFVGIKKIDNENTIDLTIELSDCIDQIYVYTNSSCMNNDTLNFLDIAKQDIISICRDQKITRRDNSRNNGDLVEILNVNGNNFL